MLRQVLSIHAALDKTARCVYNNSEEQTTHTVSSSKLSVDVAKPRIDRHFTGVAVDFLPLRVFAFLEVFRTMTVTVYFPMWKVRRIRITSFRRDGTVHLAANTN